MPETDDRNGGYDRSGNRDATWYAINQLGSRIRDIEKTIGEIHGKIDNLKSDLADLKYTVKHLEEMGAGRDRNLADLSARIAAIQEVIDDMKAGQVWGKRVISLIAWSIPVAVGLWEVAQWLLSKSGTP